MLAGPTDVSDVVRRRKGLSRGCKHTEMSKIRNAKCIQLDVDVTIFQQFDTLPG